MAMSIPAEDLHACVDHGLNAISKLCPEAVLPSAQWVLSARAQELGIAPKGQCSANGTCRLLSCLDGWLGVNLPRHSDWELLNPWLATDEPLSNWSMLTTAVASRNGLALAARGREMGLPLAFVAANASAEFPVGFVDSAPSLLRDANMKSAPRELAQARVIDLSALWAGPLCAQLLHRCGAQVTTVSSMQRPDGAQFGSPDFYRQLHAGHEGLQLDFGDVSHRVRLAELLADADVVIEASRPRGLVGLGLDRQSLTIAKPQVWLSITAYGRTPPADQWVGFGDDVAVSAGLLDWNKPHHPAFVGDAIADPLTGVYAALAVIDAMAQGESGLLDFPMAAVAGRCRQKIVRTGHAIACPLQVTRTC
jgi:hypothetical protein